MRAVVYLEYKDFPILIIGLLKLDGIEILGHGKLKQEFSMA